MLGFEISDLYSQQGVFKLHEKFCKFLSNSDSDLYCALKNNREYDATLVLKLAPYIEDFIVDLFKIEREAQDLYNQNNNFANIHKCKRQFIQRHAIAKYTDIQNFTEIKEELQSILQTNNITEALYADSAITWLYDKELYQHEIEVAAKYAVWMIDNTEDSVLFSLPKKIDYANLIKIEHYIDNSIKIIKSPTVKKRYGFKLTDHGLDTIAAIDHANYCIFCHKQGKDSCSKGLCKKDSTYKTSPTDVRLTGCPLRQKISEMNLLKSQGYNIAALAVITLDNPMCAATGHRICNECMRSCIYQKQTPVDIPGVETNILSEVLSLPYGFEIYSLLTRWNPLNSKNPIPKKNTDYKVLVAGLGPAGFTMAHYLLNDGHTVVAIDGLKIERLPSHISGLDDDGNKVKFDPIQDIKQLYDELDKRTIYGFGGVAEYGITVRWNKNYLKIIRLLLERRASFAMYGGVRFGSNITYNNAIALGFQHIALAIGAGSPNIITMKNNFANGVRMASDFLMSLQLGGAYKFDSITNLQIRMPIVVIGGGLTAIDAATEALYYYDVQVEKFAKRYKGLISKYGESFVQLEWTDMDKDIANEFLQHFDMLNEAGDKVKVLQRLGGAKVLYRKSFEESPAYKLNYEEVEKALKEGIEFVEYFVPSGVTTDSFEHVEGITGYLDGKSKIIAAKTILIAIGTKPNSILSKEDPEHFFNFIQCQPSNVTILGDLNPEYSGSVVKAMASSKDYYHDITSKLSKLESVKNNNFLQNINSLLSARIVEVIKLTSSIYEIVVKSSLAAENFSPGQFYRFQNHKNVNLSKTGMLMEPIALTGAKVDKTSGLISLIALNVGGSSSLCSHLEKNETIVLMGPTGSPTEIPKNETVLLIGGGLGNAVLLSIAEAMQQNCCKVLHFAGYKHAADRYKVAEIECGANIVVWACDETELEKRRKQDFSFCSNIIESVKLYQANQCSEINLKDIDRVLAVGSSSLMKAVNIARKSSWKSFFRPGIEFIASINSPMQCMMKEICGQCIQKYVDPVTLEEKFIYSCSNQDQDMEFVDFCHLKQRLKQNSLQEKLTDTWIKNSLY